MSANYDSIFGKHASIKGPNLRKKKWLELSEICNQLGPPHKTIEEWKRVRILVYFIQIIPK